jgi:hypothetical protein
MSRVAGAFLLLLLLTSRGSASDSGAAAEHGPGPASAALAVFVSETPDAVLLHIQATGDVEPGSVEVRFAGRTTVVLARNAMGRRIRSLPLRLPEAVVEEGASTDDDGDGALVMTLRKQATAQNAERTGDQERAGGESVYAGSRVTVTTPSLVPDPNGYLECKVTASSTAPMGIVATIMNSDGTNVTEFGSGFRASPAATGNGLYYAEETAGSRDDGARYGKATVTSARRKDVHVSLTAFDANGTPGVTVEAR